MNQRSRYQQKVIQNYYNNRDTIAMQRLGELVSELFLSEGKKRAKHWESVARHLAALGVEAKTINHLVSQDDPRLVAGLIERLMKKTN